MFHENTYIDYEPLGLPFLLQRATVLWNRAICLEDSGMSQRAIYDLNEVKKCAFNDEILSKAEKFTKELLEIHPECEEQEYIPPSPVVPLKLVSRAPGRFSVRLARPLLKKPEVPPPSPLEENSSTSGPISRRDTTSLLKSNSEPRILANLPDISNPSSPPPTPPPNSLVANKRLSRSVKPRKSMSRPSLQRTSSMVRTKSKEAPEGLDTSLDSSMEESPENSVLESTTDTPSSKEEGDSVAEISESEITPPKRPPRVIFIS